MYSVRITCSRDDVDRVSGELWAAGTLGIREIEEGESVVLIATFANAQPGAWKEDQSIDWIAETQRAWPPRLIGQRIFLAPPWNREPAPEGRFRLVHNPSSASGTGEHPCTQLALAALEQHITAGIRVVDVGTGSGILAVAARLLGAVSAIGLDTDEAALDVARENHALNALAPQLIVGSAECLSDSCADILVANINATVLLSIADEFLRISARGGRLILTGFTEPELSTIEQIFPPFAKCVHQSGEWVCVNLRFAT